MMSVSRLKGYREKMKSVIGSLDATVNKIMNDKSKLKSDREDLAYYEKSQVLPKINEQMAEMQREYNSMMHAAREKYVTYRKQSPSDLANRAAVLLPMVKDLNNKELLGLLKSRAAARLDRELIAQLIATRAEISDDHDLMSDLVRVDDETKDSLPDSEREARLRFEEVESLQLYMDQALKEATLTEAKLQGKLKGHEGVVLTTASYICDNIEQGKKVDPDTLTVKE